MKPEPMDRRDRELRRALVATADLTPFTRRRPSGKLVIGGIAAFALAGALTGGAVAYASTGSSNQAAVDATVQAAGQEWIGQQDGKSLGVPIVRSSSTTLVIQLGKAPLGANTIVESFQCGDAGKFGEGVDGDLTSGEECTTTDFNGGSQSGYGFVGTGPHTFTVKSANSARYTVWLAWAETPTLVPSSDETAELSDGFVTRAEDLAAFDRYAVCMAALGYPIDDVADMTSGIVPSYSSSTAAVDSGADNRCYVTQYRDVDRMWQIENEDGSVDQASMDKCLVDNGIQPAATPAGRIAQYRKPGFDFHVCLYIG